MSLSVRNRQKRRSEKFKQSVALLVEDGESAIGLAAKFNIPLSTIYYWHDEYAPQTTTNSVWNKRRLKENANRSKKVQLELELLRNSPFIQTADRTERMIVMEDLLKKDTTDSITAELLCEAFDIDKSTLRHFRFDGKHGDTQLRRRRKRLESRILKIFHDSNNTYGALKILHLLRGKYHERVSVDYVRKIMRDLGIIGATPRQIKRKLRATVRYYDEKRNILKQNFCATKPNEKWVSDSKQFVGARGLIKEICIVEDLYARKIVSYHIGTTENTNLVAKTLRKAIAARVIVDNLVLHTDNSSANISIRYNTLIRSNGIIHSYSGKGNPFDDAPGESFFSHFSAELLVDAAKEHPFRSERDMRERIAKFVDKYNNKRPHRFNDYLTPAQKESQYIRKHNVRVNR